MSLPKGYGSMGSGIGNPGGFTGRTAGPAGYVNPNAAPVAAPVQTLPTMPGQDITYQKLAAAAEAERRAQEQRALQRQQGVMSGYQQQMAYSQNMGTQGYDRMAGEYAKMLADAEATRSRNMGRIDQYGSSMRQDLSIAGQQALASARQSAIKRGLGNTTITDSLVRGQEFDNRRQQLSLEDQLLQNKIATDSQLSGQYQTAMQNRSQALGNQWNQNIFNSNQLAGQQLGYLGSIQENMDGYRTVADLYSQQLQMDNASREAALNRQAQTDPQGYTQMYNPRPYSGVRLGMPRRRSGI